MRYSVEAHRDKDVSVVWVQLWRWQYSAHEQLQGDRVGVGSNNGASVRDL